jgi:hypothetical protein
LSQLAEAETALGDRPDDPDQADGFWFERVQIQIQSVQHLYFLSRLDELSARIELVRPFIEERGTALQRSQFFQALVHMEHRRDRYVASAAALQFAGAALAAADQSGDPEQMALARFIMAATFTFARRDAEAEPLYVEALQRVELIGDAAYHARFLSYYTVTHRRLQRVTETRACATRALEIAEKHGFFDYVGVALANLCWVALVEGGDVEAPAARALAAWQALPANYPYPLQWLARAPLAAHLAKTGRGYEALHHWEQMLAPTQAQLPDELRLAIESALAKRSSNVPIDAASLSPIVELARRFGCL